MSSTSSFLYVDLTIQMLVERLHCGNHLNEYFINATTYVLIHSKACQVFEVPWLHLFTRRNVRFVHGLMALCTPRLLYPDYVSHLDLHAPGYRSRLLSQFPRWFDSWSNTTTSAWLVAYVGSFLQPVWPYLLQRWHKVGISHCFSLSSVPDASLVSFNPPSGFACYQRQGR